MYTRLVCNPLDLNFYFYFLQDYFLKQQFITFRVVVAGR